MNYLAKASVSQCVLFRCGQYGKRPWAKAHLSCGRFRGPEGPRFHRMPGRKNGDPRYKGGTEIRRSDVRVPQTDVLTQTLKAHASTVLRFAPGRGESAPNSCEVNPSQFSVQADTGRLEEGPAVRWRYAKTAPAARGCSRRVQGRKFVSWGGGLE